MKAGLDAGDYTGNLTVACGELSETVALSGTVSQQQTLITIAEARALANGEYALVQGIVTFIDGRNVYIQDETAGIDLYLNSGTVPSNLTIGDMVRPSEVRMLLHRFHGTQHIFVTHRVTTHPIMILLETVKTHRDTL